MMKLRSFLTSISLSFAVLPVFANDSQDLKVLTAKVLTATSAHYEASYGEQEVADNFRISVSTLDPRLRLAQCDDFLTFDIQEPAFGSGNITVKTRCLGAKPWSIYVPTRVDIFAKVQVASSSLAKGTILTAQHLQSKRINISSNAGSTVTDNKDLIGMELKRPVRTGETLRFTYVKKPNIIIKGQTVIMRVSSSRLSVQAPGIAMKDGRLGEQIKVRNEQSNRIITAMVVAPGEVSLIRR